jgi:hypothetical protein
LFSCSKETKPPELLTPDTLKQKHIKFLKKKNFLAENENIVYFYSLSKMKDEGALLTDKKILVYNKEYTDRELFSNIFDIAASHSVSAETNSTITIYRRDDTEFKAEFLGGTDADEKFFSTLKENWREALAKE